MTVTSSVRYTRHEQARDFAAVCARLRKRLERDRPGSPELEDAKIADALADQAADDLGTARVYDEIGDNNAAWACRSAARRGLAKAKKHYGKAYAAASAP